MPTNPPWLLSDPSNLLSRAKAITDRERGRAAGMASDPIESEPPVRTPVPWPVAWIEGWRIGKQDQRDQNKAKGHTRG